MLLTNKTYNVAKFIALVALPASGTLYFALSQIWGLPSGEEVVGTITAVDTFLGVLLGISSSQYNSQTPTDGQIVVSENESGTGTLYTLELNGDPDKVLKRQDTVTFKVAK